MCGKKYIHAFKNALIPKLQEVSKLSLRPIVNLATLFATGVADDTADLPLSLIRYLNFSSGGVVTAGGEGSENKSAEDMGTMLKAFKGAHGVFLRELLVRVIKLAERDGFLRIFAPLKQYADVREGVSLALDHLVLPKLGAEGEEVVEAIEEVLLGGDEEEE